MPHGFYLPHALPNEKIILLLRRHWLVLFGRELVWVVAALLPIALAWLLPGDLQGLAENPLGYPLAVVGGSAYYLFLWLFALNAFVDYYLDVWIVTNERILNIEQHQLFSRIAAEQRLSRIQDVTAETRGVFATFLHFGDVHVQTAGEQTRFVFRQIPDSTAVARKIASLAEFRRRFEDIREELHRAQL
ncbi:MAG: PH domain-containing protein [bacterium]|nr:PH domain-containing protein [bacterium]